MTKHCQWSKISYDQSLSNRSIRTFESNIATGAMAHPEVSQCLTKVKELNALKNCLETGGPTLTIPKICNFVAHKKKEKFGAEKT